MSLTGPKPIHRTGSIPFSIEGRILRELGERLVKQPEVALLELVKNAYDADARTCRVERTSKDTLVVTDDGTGMTLDRFATGWMRIGTSSKEGHGETRRFGRSITGEKGIGRFAVRFLGRRLKLESVAYDEEQGQHTRLITEFDWEEFDQHEDLGDISVDYVLDGVGPDVETGTTLTISALQPSVGRLTWKQVATGAIGVVTAGRALVPPELIVEQKDDYDDPGFSLDLRTGAEQEPDLSSAVLGHYVLRASLRLTGSRLELDVYRGGEEEPYLKIKDAYESSLSEVFADLRFFPRRPGTFANAPVDGRVAYPWIRDNSGVLVFDRGFQVRPYGMDGDDWLTLVADAARNYRLPRSSIAQKNFPMAKEVQASPAENWMLRLPEYRQLVGAVHVKSSRTDSDDEGLVPAADREGFVDNTAFAQLFDVVRGAIEAIAFCDRQIQLDQDRADAQAKLERSREDTRAAIEEIESDEQMSRPQKTRMVAMLAASQERIEQQEEGAKQREQQLEIMSLLGVIGGFMTHEFGVAIFELREVEQELEALADTNPRFSEVAKSLRKHADSLESFVAYSRAFVQGARVPTIKPYKVRPRIAQVVKVFGQYALDRDIDIDIGVDSDLMAPPIPAALYNGVVQNLFTNALKAVTARDDRELRIALRAWDERKQHVLQVSDTGVGIPSAVRERVFDPLFTTTDARKDPLGSGMGLGLSLVRQSAAAFGGKVALVDPPPGFTTCMEVRFPIEESAGEH